MVEYIYQTLGLDIQMYEALVNSWVNPTRRLLDKDYIPYLMYVETPIDGFWDIPLSPNAKYFQLFELFDIRIPDEHRLPMEFEGLNAFHDKNGKMVEEIWSNDAPKAIETFNSQSFKNSTFYQHTISRFNKEYHRTQAYFIFMNPEEIPAITRVLKNNIEKHHNMKPTYARACDFLKALVTDFVKIDA